MGFYIIVLKEFLVSLEDMVDGMGLGRLIKVKYIIWLVRYYLLDNEVFFFVIYVGYEGNGIVENIY